MNLPSVGIAGEVRCVITKADGTVKTDTGFQKNLILNQGLDFFGGGKGGSINASCVIGAGNSTPLITQTKLDAFIALASGTDITSDYSYVDTGDGMYRMWEQKKYRFAGLNNVNISEVGLVSEGVLSTNYYLTTRALIKDSLGAPTSISVKTGETLDIYYKIHKVIDTRDKAFVINVLDGDGGAVPYNVTVRPTNVGTTGTHVVSKPLVLPNASIISIGTAELSAITTYPNTGNLNVTNAVTMGSYVIGSYKRGWNINIPLGSTNVGIRSLSDNYFNLSGGLFPFQFRLGRVSDDAPLTKTDKDTLSIPLEFSWGRYEGAL